MPDRFDSLAGAIVRPRGSRKRLETVGQVVSAPSEAQPVPTWVPTSETLMENGSVDGSRSAIHSAAAAASNGDTSVRERERGVNPYGGATSSAARRPGRSARAATHATSENFTRGPRHKRHKKCNSLGRPRRVGQARGSKWGWGRIGRSGLVERVPLMATFPTLPQSPRARSAMTARRSLINCLQEHVWRQRERALKPLRSGETGRCPCGSAPPRFPCRTVATGERHRRGAWSSARHPRCRR